MPAISSKSSYVWVLYVLPLLIAGMAGLLSFWAGAFDKEVFERLMIAFGANDIGSPVSPHWMEAHLAIKTALLLILSFAATWAGYKLGSVARMLVLVQLLVLSLLFQWGLWNGDHAAGSPIALFVAIFAGCLGGYAVRMLSQREAKYESQYYELVLRNRELQETKLQIVKQDEVERRMLAADLHDQVLNDLKAIVQKVDTYVTAPDPALVDSIKLQLNHAMGDVREVMDSLCPSALEHLGLPAAIEDCLRRGSERADFKGRFRNKLKGDQLDALSMVEKSLLYRLAQESITNVCKHAQATICRAEVEMSGKQLIIQVTDDGLGIDPAKVKGDSRGIRYMRQRADLIGATIAWRPGDKGRGTVVEIRMNLSGRDNGGQSTDS